MTQLDRPWKAARFRHAHQASFYLQPFRRVADAAYTSVVLFYEICIVMHRVPSWPDLFVGVGAS